MATLAAQSVGAFRALYYCSNFHLCGLFEPAVLQYESSVPGYLPGTVEIRLQDSDLGGILNAEMQMHYFYGHYYAVQAMWIAGGAYWRQWYPAIRTELLASRQADGSWRQGLMCPHYCTAMALIILQVPNNYLPILQR